MRNRNSMRKVAKCFTLYNVTAFPNDFGLQFAVGMRVLVDSPQNKFVLVYFIINANS